MSVTRSVHKVRTYKEYHSVCPLGGIGTLPVSQPLSRQRVCPSPQNRGGGHTRLRVRGWESPNSDDSRKSLALCLLCGSVYLLLSELVRLAAARCECWILKNSCANKVLEAGVLESNFPTVPIFKKQHILNIRIVYQHIDTSDLKLPTVTYVRCLML